MQLERVKSGNRRNFTSKEERQKHIENWKLSGLSMTDYCQKNNIRLSNLSDWKRASSQKFKSIKIVDTQEKDMKIDNIVEIQIDQRIKIRLLQVTDASLIIAIARGLSHAT